jgi:ATP-dependent DNA helicase RecG
MPVQFMRGVGPHTAQRLARVSGGMLVRDLAFTAPTGAIDWSVRASIAQAPLDTEVVLDVIVEAHVPPPRGRATLIPYKVRVRDLTGYLSLAFFRGQPDWLNRQLPVESRRIVAGRVVWHRGERQMMHPDHIIDPEVESFGSIEPVYPLTEGLTGRQMLRLVRQAHAMLPPLPEWLDPSLLARQRWPAFAEALRRLHFPESAEDVRPDAPWRTRLAFDEMFLRQCALRLRRAARLGRQAPRVEASAQTLERLLATLPFVPTAAQRRAADEIAADMDAPAPMHRLLQGDVGSGKTLVAALACGMAAAGGLQVAVMAPTGLLAEQLHRVLAPLLGAWGHSAELLTGATTAAARKVQAQGLLDGSIAVAVGTHALFQKAVGFRRLGLVIIDEQHRFGVSDRAAIVAKGAEPHVLTMSATPIPRSLALAVHGDMELSVLDERPPGRALVTTRLVSSTRIAEVVARLDGALERGERAYWVCPLVSESDEADLAAAEARHAELVARFGDRVGLIHGQMPVRERDRAMDRFRAGETTLLVATVVIEVGVDVPEATIMVIEHAERYGLAQLHQLRGRVGRGGRPGACVLLYRGPLGETALRRLETLRDTADGFRIAEVDYRMRGAGDVLGLRQSGFPNFRFAVGGVHDALLETADRAARLAVDHAPELAGDQGRAILEGLRLFGYDERMGRGETA